MNKRLLGVLVFALLVAGSATAIVYRLVAAKMPATGVDSGGRVIVAAHDLEVGTLLKASDVKEADWAGKLPEHAITKVEDIVDRGVIAAVYQGEPMLDERLAVRGAGAGLASTIPVGMRAAAVRVNDVVGVAGFVTPGQRVDVLILGSPEANRGHGAMSRTLLQNIQVLSAGQQIQKDTEGKPVTVPVVNLLVAPEQAEILSLASNEARIQLVLRNPMDTKETKTPGTEMDKLFGQAAPAPATAAPRPMLRHAAEKKAAAGPPPITLMVVEMIHGEKGGAKKTEAKFSADHQEVN